MVAEPRGGMGGVDPDEIAMGGGSAGRHLAAMVATTHGDEFFKDSESHVGVSDEVIAAVIMGTGVDQVARVKETKGGSVKNCVILFGGELNEVTEMNEKGSPITHLSGKAPPSLMIDRELDRPGQHYVEFRERLDSLGVKNEFVMGPGAKHGQWSRMPFGKGFVTAMIEFVGSLSDSAEQ